MNYEIGTVKNVQELKNRDSEETQRILSCELSSVNDVQSVELSNVSGEENTPINGDTLIVLKVADAYKLGILIDDGIAPDPTLLNGEKELYSRSNQTTKAARLRLKNNSEIVLNEGTDFAVKYNALEIAFNQLKADLDQARAALALAPSTADISPAKVDGIRL